MKPAFTDALRAAELRRGGRRPRRPRARRAGTRGEGSRPGVGRAVRRRRSGRRGDHRARRGRRAPLLLRRRPPRPPAATPSLVAVTACPTGIAHTYMAAEALEAAAERAGVRPPGRDPGLGRERRRCRTTRSPPPARSIFAVDVGVRDRGPLRRQADGELEREAPDRRRRRDDRRGAALRRRPVERASRGGRGRAADGGGDGAAESWGGRVRRVLMTGVSYMIPFVAAGGLLIALSFLLGGYEIVGPYGDIAVEQRHLRPARPRRRYGLDHALFDSGLMAYLGALFFIIGKTAFALFIPALRRLHRLRDRRPARHRPRLRAGRPRRQPVQRADLGRQPGVAFPATGFLGAIVGGVLAGIVGALARAAQGADLGPRPDARPGDPAGRPRSSPGSS